jgi:hypothetical protein
LCDWQSEEHPEEKEKDHWVRDPEQPDSDIESEYQREDADDIARRQADWFPVIHCRTL